MAPGPRSLIARARAARGRRADVLLAAVVVLEGWIEVAVISDTARAAARGAGALLVIGLGVALRRERPVAAVAVGLAGVTLFVLSGGRFGAEGIGPFFAIGLLTWSLGRHCPDARLPLGLAVAAAGVAVGMVADPSNDGDVAGNIVFGSIVLIGLPSLAGRGARSRARLNAALRAKREALEREGEQRAQRAVADERTRIAGELHDVVAHALSAMTVQASAARRLTTARRDDAARDAFAAVEDTGREALGELRRLLGVLRREDEDLALAPQPSLANVAALARRACAAGLPVELTVDGVRADAVPIGVDLTAYRVVQAALGAARDEGHAERARVDVRYGRDAIVVVVADDGRGGPSRALLGMRERVEVFGGQLDATPVPSGHVVRARFPTEAGA